MQRNPGDYEAMVGLGPIVVHKKEHMATTDQGVAMFRRRLRKEVRALRDGHEPRQPTEAGPPPLPTWSGDTVLRVPAGKDDAALRARALERVAAILTDADSLRGEERDAFVISRFKELETT